jgi:hypothetical protein
MKRISKGLLKIGVGLAIITLIGYLIFQKYKYKLASNTISSTVANETDSLYSIKYDSLSFDEVNGNATIKNIRIIPDTNRAKKLTGENIPDVLLNIYIKSLRVTGVKTAKALNGKKIISDSVIIDNPQITMLSMKPLQKETKIQSEAVAVYKQILGNLDLINVGFVFINNVHVKGVDFYSKEINFDLINGKVLLENVLIDSAHNDDTSRVLFCKQAAFTIDSFYSYNHNRKELSVSNINFLGKEKQLLFGEISFDRFENDSSQSIRLLDASTLKLSGVHSNEIVKNKNFFVDTILCKHINLYEFPPENLETTKKSNSKTVDSSGFSNVYGIAMQYLNFPKVTFIPFAKSKYVVGNISVKVNDLKTDEIKKLGLHPMDYIKEAEVSISSLSIKSKDEVYNFDFKNISLNSLQKELKIESLNIVPFASEEKFESNFSFQKDRYEVNLSGIALKNIDLNSLMEKRLEASQLDVEKMKTKIYRDLHKPLDVIPVF